MTEKNHSTMLLECSNRAANLSLGNTFPLSGLFGEDWLEFLGGKSPNGFGQVFSRAVTLGEMPHVRFHSIDRSPRQARYIRVSVED